MPGIIRLVILMFDPRPQQRNEVLVSVSLSAVVTDKLRGKGGSGRVSNELGSRGRESRCRDQVPTENVQEH